MIEPLSPALRSSRRSPLSRKAEVGVSVPGLPPRAARRHRHIDSIVVAVRVHPVIMAGGSGTRFWPLSRSHRPKQLLPLTGGRALLVETVERVRPLAPAADTYVVWGAAHAAQIRRLLPRLPRANLLVEPAPRNTAPCIALAAAVVARKDPQGILLVLPSDHHVALDDAFRAALRAAVRWTPSTGQGERFSKWSLLQ